MGVEPTWNVIAGFGMGGLEHHQTSSSTAGDHRKALEVEVCA